jgi:hypothetical protein
MQQNMTHPIPVLDTHFLQGDVRDREGSSMFFETLSCYQHLTVWHYTATEQMHPVQPCYYVSYLPQLTLKARIPFSTYRMTEVPRLEQEVFHSVPRSRLCPLLTPRKETQRRALHSRYYTTLYEQTRSVNRPVLQNVEPIPAHKKSKRATSLKLRGACHFQIRSHPNHRLLMVKTQDGYRTVSPQGISVCAQNQGLKSSPPCSRC